MHSIVADPDWRRCRPMIEAALAHSPGYETIEDVERLIDDGTYLFWAAEQSAVVTEVSQYQRRRVLTVMHGGGDLAELLDYVEPALCVYARSIGCDAISGIGRRGWDRECKKRGYRLAHITMIKDLA